MTNHTTSCNFWLNFVRLASSSRGMLNFKSIRVPQSLFKRIEALADLNGVDPHGFALELLADGAANYWGSILAEVQRQKRQKRRRHKVLLGTLLERVIQVMGDKTMTFGEICDELERRGWMPELRSSVSNVFQKDPQMFTSPSRGKYAVRRSRGK